MDHSKPFEKSREFSSPVKRSHSEMFAEELFDKNPGGPS